MPIAQRLRWPASLLFLVTLLVTPAPSPGNDDPIDEALSAVVHIPRISQRPPEQLVFWEHSAKPAASSLTLRA